jgi:hypothetical protein
VGGEAGGEEPRAGADLEHAVGGLGRHRLQDASRDLGREHVVAAAERDLGIGVGDVTEGLGHERLARDAPERLEHGQ